MLCTQGKTCLSPWYQGQTNPLLVPWLGKKTRAFVMTGRPNLSVAGRCLGLLSLDTESQPIPSHRDFPSPIHSLGVDIPAYLIISLLPHPHTDLQYARSHTYLCHHGLSLTDVRLARIIYIEKENGKTLLFLSIPLYAVYTKGAWKRQILGT